MCTDAQVRAGRVLRGRGRREVPAALTPQDAERKRIYAACSTTKLPDNREALPRGAPRSNGVSGRLCNSSLLKNLQNSGTPFRDLYVSPFGGVLTLPRTRRCLALEIENHSLDRNEPIIVSLPYSLAA